MRSVSDMQRLRGTTQPPCVLYIVLGVPRNSFYRGGCSIADTPPIADIPPRLRGGIALTKMYIPPSKFAFSVTELGVSGSPLNFYNLGVGFRRGGRSSAASRCFYPSVHNVLFRQILIELFF